MATIIEWLDKNDTDHTGRVVAQIAKGTELKREDVREVLTTLQEAGQVVSEGKGATQRWRLDLHPAPALDAIETGSAAADDIEVDTVAGHGDEDESIAETEALSEEEALDCSDESQDDTAVPGRGSTASQTSPSFQFGAIDLEVLCVFNMLPTHDADSGIDIGYLVRLTGGAMTATRITKALWGMRQAGLAQSTAPWRPDRGQWRLTEEANMDDLRQVVMSQMPRRVTCPDCGHDAALNYKQGTVGPVKPFDPDAPVPARLTERSTDPGHRRDPVIMFVAMVLDQEGEQLTAERVAAFTGHSSGVVLQALWALRACRFVECSDLHRPDGGTWKATEGTLDNAPLAQLGDAPAAIGCAACGQAIATRGGRSTGGKATKGVPRKETNDGGTPLPIGSLPLMIKAWALQAPSLVPTKENDDPAVRTPTRLLGDLQEACRSGAMLDWLTTWAERCPEDTEMADKASEAIARGSHPRSAGAVKNVLVALQGNGLIAPVRDAKVETYRSIAEAPAA
ncbi:hypothetical protein [Glycomyces arizonensis]|uniref:hypothetical protein n=1 Tax=Glycomyces arizonensis TaxID=256035 RepID=UPI0012EB0E2F|nr:hypothetical protein [Glycomyces arizonensis]